MASPRMNALTVTTSSGIGASAITQGIEQLPRPPETDRTDDFDAITDVGFEEENAGGGTLTVAVAQATRSVKT